MASLSLIKITLPMQLQCLCLYRACYKRSEKWYHSTRQYFKCFGLTWLPRHDSCIIVSVCLAYLSYHHFETYDSQIFASSAEKQDRSASKDDLMLKIYSTLFGSLPVLDYAAENWGTHVSRTSRDHPITNNTIRTL